MSLKIFWLKFVAFFGGCYVCYLIQVHLHQSAVTSVALTGVLGSSLHFPKFYEKKGLHGAIFSGALAGMCSRSILENSLHVCILSFIGASIFLLARPVGEGLGGRLGTIAFVSCGVFFLMRSVW